MKDLDAFILLMAGGVVAFVLFLGVASSIKKGFKNQPTVNSAESEEMIKDQKKHAEEIKKQYERMMKEQEQRLHDSRKKL